MKILIIDDEQAIVEFLRQGLEARLFNVETASDGERGAFLARTGNYDLVLLDNVLPKLSGPEVLEEIRREERHLPVIMMSVKTDITDKKECFRGGADDYLTKPFLFDELLLRIEAILRRPAKTVSEILRIDDLMLNSHSKVVRRAGREIYLTRREFSLLEYLLRNRGRILSRQEILEHVWDYDSDPFSNSIETHVASLRRKIRRRGGRDLIHTFVGRGYKLALAKIGNP